MCSEKRFQGCFDIVRVLKSDNFGAKNALTVIKHGRGQAFNAAKLLLDLTAPAAIRVSSDGAGLACCRLHPASPPMAKLKNNRYRFSIYSFFWTSRMRSFSGFDGSAFFLPAGFLYSCPRTVTSICEPASDSRLFDNSFAAIAKD